MTKIFSFILSSILLVVSSQAFAQSKSAKYEGISCTSTGTVLTFRNAKYGCSNGLSNLTLGDLYKKGYRLVGSFAIPDTGSSPQNTGVTIFLEKEI